jgi:hypothetical protein
MRNGFTNIPNELIANPHISAGAFRLWCFIASQAEGATLTRAFIFAGLGIGKRAFDGYRAELMEAGLLEAVEVPGKATEYRALTQCQKSTGLSSTPSAKKAPTPSAKKAPTPSAKKAPLKNTNLKNTISKEYSPLSGSVLPPEKFAEILKSFRSSVSPFSPTGEAVMKNLDIDAGTFSTLADAVIDEWAVGIPLREVNWYHLQAQMRIKLNVLRSLSGAERREQARKMHLTNILNLIN